MDLLPTPQSYPQQHSGEGKTFKSHEPKQLSKISKFTKQSGFHESSNVSDIDMLISLSPNVHTDQDEMRVSNNNRLYIGPRRV